ncbi:tetratricopeptide repeat protein [Methylobacter sp.]|uniref:tetratricopeptide repeat protein n=1 Tax=Methylobacter sp. TaxID=2051955 RepID=UPI002FDE5345
MLLNSNPFYIFLIVAIATSGCAYNFPVVVDPVKDMHQSQLVRKKMPIKVGMYLSEDLKQYIYKQQKMGTTFQMRVGEYLLPIAMTMGSTMFDDVIVVNSLPPYSDSYRPDVEAVIRPEILFYYGDAVGAFSGYIKAKTKLRITAYDLGGNVLWQDEAIGESKSKNMDFVSSFLGDMEEVGKTGYQAAFSAATQIINDFYAKPPQALFALVEIKKAENLRNWGALADFELFKELYEKGQFQYDKKNYYQSLYLFAKASSIAPDEPAALFYTGASYTHTGDKRGALNKFTDIIKKKASGQEASDSKKWIRRLDDPLKVGIIDGNKVNKPVLNNGVIQDALINSGMYNVMDTSKLVPSNNPVTQADFPQFLDKCYKKGIKVVILPDIDSSSKQAQSDHYDGEDVATEHTVKISAKVYSTKKKHLKTEVQINEKSSTMNAQTEEEGMKTKQQLLQSGAKKLVLQLLKNDIF